MKWPWLLWKICTPLSADQLSNEPAGPRQGGCKPSDLGNCFLRRLFAASTCSSASQSPLNSSMCVPGRLKFWDQTARRPDNSQLMRLIYWFIKQTAFTAWTKWVTPQELVTHFLTTSKMHKVNVNLCWDREHHQKSLGTNQSKVWWNAFEYRGRG